MIILSDSILKSRTILIISGIIIYAEIDVGILVPTITPIMSVKNILINGVNDNLNLVSKITFFKCWLHIPLISI